MNIIISFRGTGTDVAMCQCNAEIRGLHYKLGQVFKLYKTRLFFSHNEEAICLFPKISASLDGFYTVTPPQTAQNRITDFVPFSDSMSRQKVLIATYQGRFSVFDVSHHKPFSGTLESEFDLKRNPMEHVISISLDPSSTYLSVSTFTEGFVISRLIVLQLVFEERVSLSYLCSSEFSGASKSYSYAVLLSSSHLHDGAPLFLLIQFGGEGSILSYFLMNGKLVRFDPPKKLTLKGGWLHKSEFARTIATVDGVQSIALIKLR